MSIGQPHFDVPEPIKQAAKAAIDAGKNGYTASQGIAELVDRLQSQVDAQYPGADRNVMVTSGTGGGLLLALMCTVNPGDEVIVFDPYFVMYPHQVTLCGGKMVLVDTHPTFAIDVNRVADAITPKTKAILVNSPSNPAGVVIPPDALRDLAELAAKRGVLLISDEIYHAFNYDSPFCSPAEFSPDVLVVDGFGKTYGMTGWRMGFAHGPKRLIDEMTKLQQFTFVCAQVSHNMAHWPRSNTILPRLRPDTAASAIGCAADCAAGMISSFRAALFTFIRKRRAEAAPRLSSGPFETIC